MSQQERDKHLGIRSKVWGAMGKQIFDIPTEDEWVRFLSHKMEKGEFILDSPEPQKFDSLDEKRDYLAMAACEWTVEKLKKPLPCTVINCLNFATVGSMNYDQSEGIWQVQPMCKSCALATAKVYGAEPVEGYREGVQSND